MSRLERVIEAVKEINKCDPRYRAWIYDDNGNIKSDCICGNVLDYLEELKEYEINVNDSYIEDFLEKSKGFNTYNHSCNIDHHLNYNVMELYYCAIIVFKVHLYGDIRGGYSEYFVCKFDNNYQMFDLESVLQYKDINDKYTADINIFSDTYSVYDYQNDIDIGEFYQTEIKDLLEEIEKK